MPCSACGGGGSSASSQFTLNRRKFQTLQQQQRLKQMRQNPIYVSAQRAAQIRAYYAAKSKSRNTLMFN